MVDGCESLARRWVLVLRLSCALGGVRRPGETASFAERQCWSGLARFLVVRIASTHL